MGLGLVAGLGADGQIRTDDLSFTKALLYQLSYVGTFGQIVAPGPSGPADGHVATARQKRPRVPPRANDTMASNAGWYPALVSTASIGRLRRIG